MGLGKRKDRAVIVDVETTGRSAAYGELVIEVGLAVEDVYVVVIYAPLIDRGGH